MIIDRTHRPWLVWSCGALALAAIGYAWHTSTWHSGPTGASPAGLAFGIAGYALMLFAGLLGARKKVPTWRLGRAQTWMRGHLWLGLLSFPLILFHGGFAWRGPLTAILMLLLFIVVISGVFGAALQHFLPGIMTAQVPLETIYEEIPHIRAQLRAEADELASAANIDAEIGDRARFDEIYRGRIRPQLEAAPAEMFFSIRASVSPVFYHTLSELERICEEQRQLNRQTRLYHWLHAWLLVHVPLSIALLVLGGVHAVVALRY
jgi:hypothetical protein